MFLEDFGKKLWEAFKEGIPLILVYVLVPILLVIIMYHLDKWF